MLLVPGTNFPREHNFLLRPLTRSQQKKKNFFFGWPSWAFSGATGKTYGPALGRLHKRVLNLVRRLGSAAVVDGGVIRINGKKIERHIPRHKKKMREKYVLTGVLCLLGARQILWIIRLRGIA